MEYEPKPTMPGVKGNLGCCFDKLTLWYPHRFSPPVLGTQEQFCSEALSKGIPIPNLYLEKPEKFLVTSEVEQQDQSQTSNYLYNWDKWCAIWRETQKTLEANRGNSEEPPLMTSGEGFRYKQEDKELFERTLPHYLLYGHNNLCKLRPATCGCGDIMETVANRKHMEFPPMEKIMFNKCVRGEMSLPKRDADTDDPCECDKDPLWKWEKPWSSTEPIRLSKQFLKKDMMKYMNLDTIPHDLIVKGNFLKCTTSTEKETYSPTGDVPLIKIDSASDITENEESEKSRGPVLKVGGDQFEMLLTYKKHPTEGVHNANILETTKQLSYFCEEIQPPFAVTTNCKETRYIFLKNEGTTAIRYQWLRFTPHEKSQKLLGNLCLHSKLNSEMAALPEEDERMTTASCSLESLGAGTSSFVYSPSMESIEVTVDNPIQNPLLVQSEKNESTEEPEMANKLSESVDNKKGELENMVETQDGLQQQSALNEPQSKLSHFAQTQGTKPLCDTVEPVPFPGTPRDPVGEVPRFYKEVTFDFHFRELPDVILPGQCIDFPIIFRPKKPGVFHETLYLMTHPQLCDQSLRGYSIHLTGLCMEPESAQCRHLGVDEAQGLVDADKLKLKFDKEALNQEANNVLNTILQKALFRNKLPSMNTAERQHTERIFYTHNKHLHYHYGEAEETIDCVRNLITNLVPRHRIENNENICSLSIQSLYQQLCIREKPEDFFWHNFIKGECERDLKQLAEHNQRLMEPRSFAWPSKDMRKYSACLSTLIAAVDEIVHNMEHFKMLEKQDENNMQDMPSNSVARMNSASSSGESRRAFSRGSEESVRVGGSFDKLDEIREHLLPAGSHKDSISKVDASKTQQWIHKSHKDINSNTRTIQGTSSEGLALKKEENNPQSKRQLPEEPEENDTVGEYDKNLDDRSEYVLKPGEKVVYAPLVNIIPILSKLEIDDPNLDAYENILCEGIESMLNIVDSMEEVEEFSPSDLLTIPEDDEC